MECVYSQLHFAHINYKSQEVGDESRLARSFERIRSIIRKQRMGKKGGSTKMEEVVNEVIRRERKQKFKNQYPLSVAQTTLYRRSYEESLKRPISGSDFGYEIPLKNTVFMESLMLKEDVDGEQTTNIDAEISNDAE